MCCHSKDIKSLKRDSDVPLGCWISTTGTRSTFCRFYSGSCSASSSKSIIDPTLLLCIYAARLPSGNITCDLLSLAHVTQCFSSLLDTRLLAGDTSPAGPLPDAPSISLLQEISTHNLSSSIPLTQAACFQISLRYAGEGEGLLSSNSPFLPEPDASSICTWHCRSFTLATH